MNIRSLELIVASALVLVTVSVSAPASEPEKLTMQEAKSIVQQMQTAWEDVDGYTNVTYKRERHDGELIRREKILMKFKKPFSVYMKWVKDNPPEYKNPNLGQEMIYEKGWNNNKIYAHLGKRSFLPSAITSLAGYYYDWSALGTSSRAATYNQRHTIDEVPYGYNIDRIAQAVQAGLNNPNDGVYFVDHGKKKVMGKETSRCIEGYMPADKREAYYAHRVYVCIDDDTKMPSQFKVHNKDDVLLENYKMVDIKVNIGLDTKDFRPDNPEYNF